MCGRIRQPGERSSLAKSFAAGDLETIEANEIARTLAPTQSIITIMVVEDGRRVLADREWGLIP